MLGVSVVVAFLRFLLLSRLDEVPSNFEKRLFLGNVLRLSMLVFLFLFLVRNVTLRMWISLWLMRSMINGAVLLFGCLAGHSSMV